jgi:hypothetical protein
MSQKFKNENQNGQQTESCKVKVYGTQERNQGLGTDGVTQVVDHLPNKCETLSSNPSTAKKNKRKGKKEKEIED